VLVVVEVQNGNVTLTSWQPGIPNRLAPP